MRKPNESPAEKSQRQSGSSGKKLVRVVLDTNVLISALFWHGNEYEILRKAFEGEFELLISRAIISEFKGVLSEKFGARRDWIGKVANILTANSVMIHPKHKLNIIKDDESDNRVLECAVEGGANCIISGDSHLLKLQEYRGIRVLRSEDFLEALFE